MSKLAERHIELNAQLRDSTVKRLTRIWRSLPEYRDETLPAWLNAAVPVVQAAQRAEITVTQAYLSRALGRTVRAVSAEEIMAMYRNGTPPADVYSRPFGEVWSALAGGATFDQAQERGLFRATQTAATDIQATMRDTLNVVGEAEPDLWGYQRVTDGAACSFCLLLNGAQLRTEDPMPIHPNCGCGVEPVVYTRGFDNRNNLATFNASPTPPPKGVAVRDHGELGPVLGDPSQNFTTAADI